jgi:hypothetical protein
MPLTGAIALRLATALGIGLLIGAERERRKGQGASRSPAGIRTFAITCLLGGVSLQLGGEVLLAIATLAIAALVATAYIRTRAKDPGLTTETALLLTLLLGGLAMRQPALASGLAVTQAILLASRTRIHRFVRSVLTEAELTDALILAAAVLVVLPLIPDRYVGPFGAINPRMIWKIVLLMISISASGYIAVRLLGVRFAFPSPDWRQASYRAQRPSPRWGLVRGNNQNSHDPQWRELCFLPSPPLSKWLLFWRRPADLCYLCSQSH